MQVDSLTNKCSIALIVLSSVLLGANKTSAATFDPVVFTDPLLFNNPTIIDFEPSGSGNSISSINNFLTSLSTGATLSIGGAGARIDDLSDSDRALGFGISPGADGAPFSGDWGFEGGVFGQSFVTLTFSPGNYVEAVGTYWGGVANTTTRAVVTLEDNTTFTALLSDLLPLVPNSALETDAINGFLGISGNSQRIKEVSFFGASDLYSQDNLTFGTANISSTPIPESSNILGLIFISIMGFAMGNQCVKKYVRPTKIARFSSEKI